MASKPTRKLWANWKTIPRTPELPTSLESLLLDPETQLREFQEELNRTLPRNVGPIVRSQTRKHLTAS